MACPHVDAQELRPPGPNQPVYKDECTQCFDSVDHLYGIAVCLYCYNGGCLGDQVHSKRHYDSTHHPLVLNIKRVRKLIKRDQPPHKISKLAITAETEEDRYETHTKVVCYKCNQDDVDRNAGKLPSVVEGVLKASTFARREEVKAWEQEFTPCEHTLILNQDNSRRIASQDLGHCSMCELRENLWLCLQCGNLGCGRAQFGGIGGNSHGLAHSDQTHHPVAVKLGSITPDGSADVYCYSCQDERTDPQLSAHLGHWGINISEREKTEKSLTELQIEQNLRWEFSMTTEDGKDLKPVFGPSLTGLRNLGNSCYLASVMQCLMALRCFQTRYEFPMNPPPVTEHPAEDFETQMRKLADGLLSGRWSEPDPDVSVSASTPELHHQKGVAPTMFKHLIGRGHQEFSTMRQQDAYEFLLHLFKMIRRSPHLKDRKDPTIAFRFVMEQRLQCLHCKRVRYRQDEQDNISVSVPARKVDVDTAPTDGTTIPAEGEDRFAPVTLEECLDQYTSEDVVQLTCPACGSKQGFSTRTMFKTFPDILAINCRRFQLVNWVPTKLDIPVVVSDQHLRLDRYLSKGPQGDEELLAEDGPSDSVNVFEPNALALSQLEAMGFPRVRAERALQATENVDAEAAMSWLFEHMDDADLDTPLHQAKEGDTGRSVEVDPEKVDTLGVMGFSEAMAKKALRETGGDTERAVDWLFNHLDEVGIADDTAQAQSGPAASGQASQQPAGSDQLPARYQLHSIVCHKGTSIHAGHYVAFIRKFILNEGVTDWVLFNDEKVVKAVDADEMKKFAYIYFFQRV